MMFVASIKAGLLFACLLQALVTTCMLVACDLHLLVTSALACLERGVEKIVKSFRTVP